MRAWSVLVLAMFLAGPGLRAECLLLCAKTDQAAVRSGCHDDPADTRGPAMDAHHDCATNAPALVTAIKRANPQSPASAAASVTPSSVVTSPVRTDLLSHGPPSAPRRSPVLVPLRI